MLIYRFKPATRTDHRVALSRDEAGTNLPGDGAPWQPIGTLDLDVADPWVKAPRAEIEAALDKHGFFIWGISVPKLAGKFEVPRTA